MNESPAEILNLSNGARLSYVKTNTRVGHICFYFKCGSRIEEAHQIGLAHFLEHSIFKGTTKRNSMWILSRLDEVGGELNAYTSKEEICVHATFLNRYTQRATDLICDLILNSIFPEKEIEKEKEVVIDEINSYKDSPVDRLMDDFDSIYFKGHALGNNILGDKKSVKAIQRKDLLAFVKSYFTADNLVISYVGKYAKAKLVQVLETLLSDMPRQGKAYQFVPPVAAAPFEIRKKESQHQSHAILGAMAPSYTNTDRAAMNLIVNYLGGPAMNSKLNVVIREKHGLAYHVEASYSMFEDCGFWGVLLSAEQKNIDKSIELAKKEIQKLFDFGMTASQLKKSKYQFLSQLSIGWENNNSRALANGKLLLVFDKVESLPETYKRFESISLEEINTAAKKYLDPKGLSMLVYDKK